MKYVDEFRDPDLAHGLSLAIHHSVRTDRDYRFMEFCGGHTHTISRYGLGDLLPDNVRMIHGPGCPVCVLPTGRIDMAIRLVREAGVVLCSYGDCLRVPGSDGLCLLESGFIGNGQAGGEIRMVYSSTDALRIAEQMTDRQVVFFAIGFETTAPATAVAIRRARASGLKNFSVLCCHVLTPPAIVAILAGEAQDGRTSAALDGLIGPAHVSTILGSKAYEFVANHYGRPVVIAGFEPVDVLHAILMLVEQVNQGLAAVENQFLRAVTPQGNRKAQSLLDAVFTTRKSFAWRGLGELPDSALQLRAEFVEFDAERRFAVGYQPVADHPACDCGAILRGSKDPTDCKLFATLCTPHHPLGACMVSSEGACAAHYACARVRNATGR